AWRFDPHPAFKVGIARLLGPVLPGSAAFNGKRPPTRFRRNTRAGVHSPAGLGVGTERLPSARQKLLRSQRDREFERVFPADHRTSAPVRLGSRYSFAATLSSGRGLPGVRLCARSWIGRHNRWLDRLLGAGGRLLPTGP